MATADPQANEIQDSDIEGPAPAAPSGDGVAEIAEDLIEHMSEPSQHAIDAHAAKAQTAPEVQRDKAGNTFDPSIHATGVDGKPVLTAGGLYAKRRGRKAGQSTLGSMSGAQGPVKHGTGEGSFVPPQGIQNGRVAVDPAVLGAGAAAMTVQVFTALFGEDLLPEAKNKLFDAPDMLILHQGWRDYFLATGRKDLPPIMGLCVAIGAYAGPKLTKPNAQTRVKMIAVACVDGVRNLWGRFKAWRTAKKQ